MNETDQRPRRQADWQRARRDLSWPEKIRQAERVRSTVGAFRAQRRRLQESPVSCPQTPAPRGGTGT